MKRTGTAVVAALLVLGLGAGLAGLVRPRAGPSILLVTIDTLRGDRLGCQGYAAASTASLDALAAEGAAFEDCSATSPVTLPSHASLLTGLLPPHHGLRDNGPPRPLAPSGDRSFRTAAEVLRAGGWRTAAFVSGAPLAPRWGLDAGFDLYDPPPENEPGGLHLGERSGGATSDAVLGWLGRRDRSRPFFLWVHLFDPHHPYAAPGGAGHPADSPEAYDEEVAYADRQAGRILDFLRREGSLDRTVVAVASDHGEGLGEHGELTHGYFLHRSTLRVPLLLRYPPRIPAGTRVTGAASLVDVLPTLLELARLPAEGPLDGASLLPRFAPPAPGAAGNPLSEQYAETFYGWSSFRWAQSVALRAGDRRVLDHGGDRREAYDLRADPGETRDLAGTPAPGDAEAAARAWAIFGSPPRFGPGATGGGVGVERDLAAVGYIAPALPVVPLPSAENGRLPLPSVSFLRRFDAALRLLQRAAALEDPSAATEAVLAAREALGALDREQPGNPAVPFWIGRSFRQEARLLGERASGFEAWGNAFFRYQEAGRRGYKDTRTVSLMLEALFGAHRAAEMVTVAREAVDTERMDGDAGFWTWVAIAWAEGEKDPFGKPTAAARARFDDAIRRALSKARSPGEEERIGEVRAKFQ